ncbi:MAG: hypothetical protein H6712_35165 [Myxococcales bacterium]|nr:hypothetical protein [Myxococcales bacterium]
MLAASACSETEFEVVEDSEASWMLLECDPIAPSVCGFPFPSNVYTVADDSTPTGRRLELSRALLPASYYGVSPSPQPWNQGDGFSASSAIMTHFPGLTQSSLAASNVATPATIDRSMEFDSPTILIDVETLERVPHWVELDATAVDNEQRTLLIRPALRLADGHRYVVAIRRLVDEQGEELVPSEAFESLRTGLPSDEPSVRGRRALYSNIFKVLETADVLRHDLQLAWDFTTASRENNTSWMLRMRDTALELVGTAGPEYRITQVDADWETEHIAYRIRGEMRVPLFLDQPGPGAHLVLGDDGLPMPNPDRPWEWFPFEVLVPRHALGAPAPLLQYGHGLLGEKEQIESEHLRTFIDEYGYVLFGVDFIGMAADDELHVGAVVSGGRLDEFSTVVARQHQGMLNSLLAMRMMKGGFSRDPQFGSYVDGNRAFYYGISQGGIFGGTYMALTTDVDRGALGVMGQPYNLLLSRSVDFDPFFDLLRGTYPDQRDVWMVLGLTQILWDRIEPAGYSAYIRGEDVLPGTQSHEVLMRAALGDHQVNTLGAHVMARSIGVTHLQTGLREVYGLPAEAGPIEGSAYVEYDFGLPPDPEVNLPQRECDDPHGKLRQLDAARRQLDVFLRNGRAESFCDGPCVFDELSGCGP